MKVTQIHTRTKVIVTALEDLIRKSKISGLKRYKGKVDLDIDMNEIRGIAEHTFSGKARERGSKGETVRN